MDLGLPSETKWAKYNIGATKESEYGDLFAWGCTNPYRMSGGASLDNTDNYSKCFANTIQTNLQGVTDTATFLWGKGWKMPTKAQLDELSENCIQEWVQIGGTFGKKFTSKINGNYVFFPAAGYLEGTVLKGRGAFGLYWTSLFFSWEQAYRLYFSSAGCGTTEYKRYYGYPVRAVRA